MFVVSKSTRDNKVIKTFARRKNRPFKDSQKQLFEKFLPQCQISEDCDFNNLKSKFKEINFEIGFGNGDFILKQALDNPDKLYIGCEAFLNGVASLLVKIFESKVQNIMIYPDDARILIKALPDKFLNNIYIICPDPWPKRRHYERRLLNSDFFKFLITKMNVPSFLKIITDHENYAKWILKHLELSKAFKNLHESTDDYKVIEPEYLTKYQLKGIEQGHHIYSFDLKLSEKY